MISRFLILNTISTTKIGFDVAISPSFSINSGSMHGHKNSSDHSE